VAPTATGTAFDLSYLIEQAARVPSDRLRFEGEVFSAMAFRFAMPTSSWRRRRQHLSGRCRAAPSDATVPDVEAIVPDVNHFVCARGIGEQELIDRGIVKSSEGRRRDALIALGVSPDSIVIFDGQTDSTADEARLFAEWASSHPIRRAIVVTSPPHTYRSRLAFSRAVENLGLEILVHRSSRHPFRRDDCGVLVARCAMASSSGRSSFTIG
jgi:hypothetical protein